MTLATEPRPPAPLDPAAGVAAIVRASGSSFTAGMRVLPRARREAVFALYAFCRVVDDVADGDAPGPRKLAALEAWRDEVERVYRGAPNTALGRALLGPIGRYALPREEFRLILEGMRMDALGPIVAPDLERLQAYTRRVAGAVGLLSLRIFGAWRGEASRRFGLALADGLQLVNILRDVEEDAARGRLYLPAEALARAGVPPEPQAALASPNLAACRAEIGRLARRRLGEACAEIAAHDRLRIAPALLMMGPYAGYLRAMERDGFRRAPARLSPLRKLALGLGCALRPQV